MTVTVGSYGLIEDTIEWHIKAGSDSYAGPFQLTGPAPTYTPIDLTGYTAACEVRTTVGGELLARLSTAALPDPTIEITALTGTILLWLPAAVSAMWDTAVKKGVFDIELYDPDGTVTMLGGGNAVIRPNITTGSAA